MLIYFILHGVITLALYKGLHVAEAMPVQKGGCWEGTVELAEMLNIL